MKLLLTLATAFLATLALSQPADAHIGISVGFGNGFGGHYHEHPYYDHYHDHFYRPYDYDVGAHRYWHHGYYQGRMGWWWVNGGSYTYYDQPTFGGSYGPSYESIYQPPQTVIIQQPAPVVPPPAQIIVQQPESAIQEMPAASTGAVYYYCRDPQGYYPTVASCPSGWAASPAPGPK
jgi:hypothetical protein